jgi:hypothetical protein
MNGIEMDAIVKYPNRWPAGVSGNPNGRPTGSRTAFSEGFMRDVAASWDVHGMKAIEHTAKSNPAGYFAICARLVPQNVAVSIQTHASALDAHDLSILRAIRDAIPHANEMEPQAVLDYTLKAIQSYSACSIIDAAAEIVTEGQNSH